MCDKPYDYDNERGMCRPAAWRKAKEALGDQYGLDLLFRRLERIASGRTARHPLAFAVHAFTMMTPKQRAKAQADYFLWFDMIYGKAGGQHKTPPREAPAAERDEPAGKADTAIAVSQAETVPPGHRLVTDHGHMQMWEGPASEASPAFGRCYWRCGDCGKRYLDPAALRRHLLKLHGVDGDAIRAASEAAESRRDVRHACAYCEQTFTNITKLAEHVQRTHFNGGDLEDGEGWKEAA
jgi:hypothetical protein